MKINMKVEGSYGVKFRIFKTDLWWIKGPVKENISFEPPKVSKTITLVNKFGSQITVGLEDSQYITVSAYVLGAKVASEKIDVGQLALGSTKPFTIKFNERGISLDVVCTVSAS